MDGDLEFLEKLIGVPSVAGDVAAVNRAVAIVCERMESQGVWCAVERMEDGCDVAFASNDGLAKPDVLLCVHLDVVPADCPDMFIPPSEEYVKISSLGETFDLLSAYLRDRFAR